MHDRRGRSDVYVLAKVRRRCSFSTSWLMILSHNSVSSQIMKPKNKTGEARRRRLTPIGSTMTDPSQNDLKVTTAKTHLQEMESFRWKIKQNHHVYSFLFSSMPDDDRITNGMACNQSFVSYLIGIELISFALSLLFSSFPSFFTRYRRRWFIWNFVIGNVPLSTFTPFHSRFSNEWRATEFQCSLNMACERSIL